MFTKTSQDLIEKLNTEQKGKLLVAYISFYNGLKNNKKTKSPEIYNLEYIVFEATKKDIQKVYDNETKRETIESKKEKTIKTILNDEIIIKKYGQKTVENFVKYWGENNTKGVEKRVLQKTFDINLRLTKRKENEDTNFGRNPKIDYMILEEFNKAMRKGETDKIKLSIGIENFKKMKELWKNSSLYLEYL